MLSISQNPLISFLVFLSILSSQTIKAIDIYVSSAASLPGDGSQALPYSSLVSALNATYIDSSVRILLLNNQNSYIIDSELNITYNLQIAYNNGGINAILDFSNKGSINLNGLFSMVLINIQMQQTSPNYQPTVSALNLVNSLSLNITNSIISGIQGNLTLVSVSGTTNCIFSRTQFRNNSIYRNFIQFSNVSTLTFDSCNFSQTYIESGFYIYTKLTPVLMTNCSVYNNTINQTNVGTTYSFIRTGSSLDLSKSMFQNNYLSNTSLIFIENDQILTQITVNIWNGVAFVSNTQILEMALGINILGQNVKVLIQDNVTFRNNYARNSFIYISNTLNTLDIENLTLINNFGFEMVALQLISNITIDSMQCLNNNNLSSSYYLIDKLTDTPGNCLSVVNYANFQLNDCYFSLNFATSSLTGVLLEHSSDISLLGVTADQGKAYFNNFKCVGNLANATLTNLLTSGNCILLGNSGSTTITSSQVLNNIVNVDLEAEYSGNPCLISTSNDNNLTIIDSVFKGNMAYSECSCLNFHGTFLLLKNVSFIENRSIKLKIGNDLPTFYVDNEGGCMNLGAGSIVMQDVMIFNSSAMKGAGIFFHNKNSKNNQVLDAFNVSIIRNEGIQTSGIEFDASLIVGEYTFTNCVINYNKVEFYGVISTFYYTAFNIYYYGCDISYNWGISAGAAFSFYHFGGNFYINKSRIAGNTLNQSVFVGGAGLFLYGTTYYTLIYVKECTFINNTSTLKGGAIQTMYGQVFAEDSVFIDNVALYGGAVSVAIYCPGSYKNVVVRNKYFVSQGGAFHFSEQAQVDLTNVSIYDCSATQGGGIYLDGSQMGFTYSSLNFYNVSADDGAAIWLLNTLAAETKISNVHIENSTTTLSSLLNIDSVNIILTNLTLSGSKGRVIFINNSTLTLNHTLITNHICLETDNQGCFAFVQEISLIIVANFMLKNLVSNFIEDSFSVIDTEIYFSNVALINCTSTADTILVTAVDSKVYLSNSIIQNLTNALIAVTNTELVISNNSFINISSATSYGIIQVTSGLNFLMSFCDCVKVSGKYGGCLSLLAGSSNYFYEITNVVVNSSSAFQGAGIYIQEQSADIINSTFINNNASDGGGGIYFDCVLDGNYSWVILGSYFHSNTANQGGAFHSFRCIPYYDKRCVFSNNTAKYGNDFSGFPIRLSLEIDGKVINCDQTPKECYLRSEITSGQTTPPLVISVLDYYGQKMTLLDGLGFLDLVSSSDGVPVSGNHSFENFTENSAPYRSEAVFTGVKTQRSSNGSFSFLEAVIQSQPPSNAWIKVKSDLIPSYFDDLIPNNTFFNWKDRSTGDYNFIFKVYFRECVSGEVYFNNATECNVCPKGKYSFSPSDTDCKTCPITAECDGGNSFSLHTGYWRPNNESDDVYDCNILTDSCLGGVNSSCLNGYDGVLCGSCIYNNQQQFFKKGMYFCEECGNVWIYIIIVVFVVIAVFVFIVFLITRKGKSTVENYVLVKIITNHIQTVSFLSNIKIEFPKFLKGFNSVQAPVTSVDSFVFTIECFKDSFSIPIYSMKLILSVVITFAVVFLVIASFLVLKCFKNKNEKKKDESQTAVFKTINSLVIVGCFFQPPFINFYIQNLSCDTINDIQYMTYNLDQECWNPTFTTYSFLITLPFLIFWMLVFPLIFFIYIRRNRKILNTRNYDDPEFNKKYQITRFFLAGYETRTYYWEFIQMLRKFSVILLTTFLRNSPQSVVYILIPVIAFFFILQIANMPFEKSPFRYNFLEILSLNACFITYYSAVFYLRVISDISRTFFLAIILIANGVFFFFWTQKYLLVLKGKISMMISNYSQKHTLHSHRNSQNEKSSINRSFKDVLKSKMSSKGPSSIAKVPHSTDH